MRRRPERSAVSWQAPPRPRRYGPPRVRCCHHSSEGSRLRPPSPTNHLSDSARPLFATSALHRSRSKLTTSGFWAGHSLAVHRRHLLLRVTRPGHILRRERRVEPRHLFGAERKVCRADVFFEVLPSLGAGDRDDVRALVQQPGKRDLSRACPLLLSRLAHCRCRSHVRVEIFALVARIVMAIVALRILLGALH